MERRNHNNIYNNIPIHNFRPNQNRANNNLGNQINQQRRLNQNRRGYPPPNIIKPRMGADGYLHCAYCLRR